MLRTILIGIDARGAWAATLPLGVGWARGMNATLAGLAIVDEPGIRAIEPAWPVGGVLGEAATYYMGYEPRLEAVEKQARAALDQFASRCSEAGVAHTELRRSGSPDELIQEEAQTADLIILARGSQFRFIAGDDEADETIKRAVKDAPRPVVVVPPLPWPGGSVIIAYDGSLQAARALAAFEATGLGKSGKVHVISVGSSASETARHAEIARTFLSRHEIESTPCPFCSSSPPAEVILEEAHQLGAGLLVLGAYGQPTLREFFMGSETKKVLEQSAVPLFLYH